MDKSNQIYQYLTTLQLFATRDNLDDILLHAEKEDKSYQALVYDLLKAEIDSMQTRAKERRLRQSNLYSDKTIEEFDFDFQSSISRREMNQVLEFEWLKQAFKLIFLGPPRGREDSPGHRD